MILVLWLYFLSLYVRDEYLITSRGERASLEAQIVKSMPELQKTQLQSLCQKDPQEKGESMDRRASSVQSMGMLRVGHIKQQAFSLSLWVK